MSDERKGRGFFLAVHHDGVKAAPRRRGQHGLRVVRDFNLDIEILKNPAEHSDRFVLSAHYQRRQRHNASIVSSETRASQVTQGHGSWLRRDAGPKSIQANGRVPGVASGNVSNRIRRIPHAKVTGVIARNYLRSCNVVLVPSSLDALGTGPYDESTLRAEPWLTCSARGCGRS
jgi:hypothetical protein